MNARKNFFSHDTKPTLEQSICVFMDVLGFREEQEASFKREAGQEELLRFHSIIKHELELLNLSRGVEDEFACWELKAFTDNIVLGFPLFTPRTQNAEPEIGLVLMDISRYQMAMARAGYFVRGGFASGPLFMDNHLIYGPALLEAYRLEREVARDPRIVVSRQVRELVERHIESRGDPEYAWTNRAFLLDTDGQIFVHYLADCLEEGEEGSDRIDVEALGIHQQHIEKRLRDFEPNPRVWAKYAWLASYHDFAIHEWSELGLVDPKLCIDRKLHRIAPVRICPFLIRTQRGEG